MKLICDNNTEEYLKQIVTIHARRMVLEQVEFWWKDEPLMVIIAGLLETKSIELPCKPHHQVIAIADFCASCCGEAKIHKHPFILIPAPRRAHEYTETLERAKKYLLIS